MPWLTGHLTGAMSKERQVQPPTVVRASAPAVDLVDLSLGALRFYRGALARAERRAWCYQRIVAVGLELSTSLPRGRSDAALSAGLVCDLHSAQQTLSAYREALARRHAAATRELITRYREDPSLCLSVLPLPR